IAKHNVFHHNEIELHSFRNEVGNRIVYYKYVFNWGTGILHTNYLFYCYQGGRLVPCLNLLQEANQVNYISPQLQFESKIVETQPLTIRMNYDWSVLSSYNYTNPCDSSGITRTIAGGSCLVRFRWNDAAKK